MCGQEEYGKSKCTSDNIYEWGDIHYVDLEIEWVKTSSSISVLSALHLNSYSWKPKYEVKIEGSN